MNAENSKWVQQPSTSPIPSKRRRYLKPEVTLLRLAEIIQGSPGSRGDSSTQQD